MRDHYDRALDLAVLGAPMEAQAMALLVAWKKTEQAREWPAIGFLEVSRWAAHPEPGEPYPMLPEIEELLAFDAQLPVVLRIPGWHVPRSTTDLPAETPTVSRTVEAITPWITSSLPFANAVKLADDASQWARATPQMEVIHYEPLPRNGALWRGRLTKRTDFGKPLVDTELVTEETIEITAEGSDDGQAGHRRYGYVLYKAEQGKGLMSLLEDTGWIEMSGDECGTQIRMQKRAAISRPVEDPLAAILTAGFAAELWMWVTGFYEAAGAPHEPIKAPPPPLAYKRVDVKAGVPVQVAVLGGGPAGLACAWLLSKPTFLDEKGKPHDAWSHSGCLDVKVTLIEKECRPGGKAASGRHTDPETSSRIDEHGLHVLMGCYANLLKILESVGFPHTLDDISTTLIPYGDPADLHHAWQLKLGPWEQRKRPKGQTLELWVKGRATDDILQVFRESSPETRQAIYDFDQATLAPRPLTRAFVGIARQLSALGVPSLTGGLFGFWRILVWWLLVRVFLAELNFGYLLHKRRGQPQTDQPHSDIAPLARLLRAIARAALPADHADPKVRLASEVVELVTTIAIGIDELGLFPIWAVDDPSQLPAEDYAAWVRALQTQDADSLQAWLVRYQVAEGFPQRSRLLAAVTAGLFTTPDQIGAGTFINGIARLLLNYVKAPYKRMLGGTGEAVIGPIYRALLENANFTPMLGHAVTGMSIVDQKVVAACLVEERAITQQDFGIWPPGTAPGWQLPPHCKDVSKTATAKPFDAFVLAIPPFAGALTGLPPALAADLAKVESRATIGLQHWSTGEPFYQRSIVSGYAGPLRCAAAMDHLVETPHYTSKPVYACGDVDDDVAEAWRSNEERERDNWLKENAAKMQAGGPFATFVSVNHAGSARYVTANVATQRVRRHVYDTGTLNLWLAGDWTRSALSCGSIEAAVTSGLEAARHLLQTLGCEVHFPIVGPIFERKKQ